jgi:nitroreductase
MEILFPPARRMTMDTFEAIAARRSVKKFDPDHVMTENEINRLMEAVILSPTAFNIQNWRFVVITDPEMKQEFRKIGWNQAQFSDCSAIVLVCGDRLAYAKETERYWANAPAETQGFIVPMIKQYYDANVEARRDENLRSGGMAAQTIMLAAKAMGYDSCPMSGFDFAKAGELVKMPEDHDIIMSVTVGKALEPARERGGQLPLNEVCVRNSF